MKLEIKHLAPYLPYGLKFKVNDNEHIKELRSVPFLFGNLHLEFGDNTAYEFQYCKPILRPLSYLTLIWLQENIDQDLENILINCEPDKGHLSIEVTDKFLGTSAFSYEEYVLLFEHHFDVFGLIDAGLAIDINTLKDPI